MELSNVQLSNKQCQLQMMYNYCRTGNIVKFTVVKRSILPTEELLNIQLSNVRLLMVQLSNIHICQMYTIVKWRTVKFTK